MNAEFTDLGYVNGWKETPEILKKCASLSHILFSKKVGKCLYEYRCGVCKFFYLIDSSG